MKIIFEKYVYNNMSIYEIAKYLNLFGFKTKQKKDFERRSVEYILKNPIYKGYIRWNRTHSASKTVRDASRWIIAKGEHEPVISEELYELAHKKLSIENTGTKARPVTEYKHWLSGMVKCGSCGRSMTASRIQNSQYYRFSCNGYSKGKCPVCRQQLARLQEKENRIRKAYVSGVDTLEEYEENKTALAKEEKRMREQLQKLENDHSKTGEPNPAARINSVYEIITSDAIDNRTKNQVLKTILDKIVYDKKEGRLDIYFKYHTLPQ